MLRLVIVSILLAAVCGRPDSRRGKSPQLDGRIVGGELVDIANYPHQVSLQYYGSHICGGTIISSKHIVTAAHCTDGIPSSALSVRAGSSIHNRGGQVMNVAEIRQHPNYNSRTMENDISVIVVPHLSVGSSVRLPTDGEDPTEGTIGSVTGWGYLWENGPIPDQLQSVQVPIIDRKLCASAYYPAPIDESMVCAGYLGQGAKDACQGDSGGPLVIGNQLVGVVSWGYGCASPLYPGVYANVGYLRSFIRKQTGV